MNTNLKTANRARVLYLALTIFTGFAFFYRENLIVAGDASATVENILAAGWMFRFNLIADFIGQICYILLALTFYQLFKSVNKTQASLLVVFVLVGIPIMMLNLLNHSAILLLMSDAEYLKVFVATQIQAAILFLLNLLSEGTIVVQIFWGLWLFPLGVLVYQSNLFPKILGIALIVGCFGYLIATLTHILFPAYLPMIEPITLVAMFGEIAFLLWFIIRGVDKSKLPLDINQ